MKDKKDYVLIHGEEFYVENHDPGFIKDLKAVEESLFKKDEVEYLGYWYVKDAPGYVWHSKNPNRDLGHKDYVILKHRYNPITEQNDFVIMGYDREDMIPLSTKSAAACQHCKVICWSLTRHDYHACHCEDKEKQICVDGGSDYMRMSFGSKAIWQDVDLDFINKMVNNKTKKRSKHERKVA